MVAPVSVAISAAPLPFDRVRSPAATCFNRRQRLIVALNGPDSATLGARDYCFCLRKRTTRLQTGRALAWVGEVMTPRNESSPLLHPDLWRGWAAAESPVASDPCVLRGGFLQSWRNTSSVMLQPPLDHHLIVLHQGGPKRVHRDGGGGNRVADVEMRAVTTAEAGSAYRWRTEGPIAFSHFYVRPDYFATLVGEMFDRDPASVSFAETLGRADPHAANLFDLLLDRQHDPDWALSADFYVDALLIRIATTSTWGGEFRQYRRLSLAPHVVTRVRDFIRSNIGQRITLEDLATEAGYSRFHFVRSFKHSTGLPPYAFVLRERIDAARDLLDNTALPIAEIAQRCGFSTHTHFSTRFREAIGLTPADYRRRSTGGGEDPLVRSPERAG